MTEHSPTPWDRVNTHGAISIVDANGECVMDMACGNSAYEWMLAGSIVTAVNAHAKLVEALEAAGRWIKPEEDFESWEQTLHKIDAALALAREVGTARRPVSLDDLYTKEEQQALDEAREKKEGVIGDIEL